MPDSLSSCNTVFLAKLKIKKMRKPVLFLASLLITANILADTLTMPQWLVVSGPQTYMPAFSETESIKGKTFSEKDLFSFSQVDFSDYFPEEGKFLPGVPGNESKWTVAMADESGSVSLEKPGQGTYAVKYLAAYLTLDRWTEVGIELHSRQMIEVYLNGKKLDSKSSVEKTDKEPGKLSEKAGLAAGKHLLMVKTFYTSDEDSPWLIKGIINLPDYTTLSDAGTELHPRQGKNIHHLLDGIKTTSASLSPDGKFYAISYRRTLPPSDKSESWTDIKRVSDSRLVQSFRHASVQSISWAPSGNLFSYRTTRDGKSSIWVFDIESGTQSAVLEDVEDFGSYSWSPDTRFLIYSIREQETGASEDLKRLLGMQDRLPGFRARQFLYKVDIATGTRQRLTHGHITTSLQDISPDSKKILFSQSRPDYLERPYSKQDLFIMDLQTGSTDTLFKDLRWGVSATFSPDGKHLLLTGGPSAFGTLGENVPDEVIPNNYDRQAYIYEIATGKTDPVTRDFDPSVSQAHWNRADNSVYLLAGEGDGVSLFSYNLRTGAFTKIDTEVDVVDWIRFAENEPVAIFSGSGMSSPPKVSLLNLKNGRIRDIENPDKENFRNVVFGSSLEWDFETADGINIPGRVYLPPDFDQSEKYPVIVYYYGGTTPVSRSFGGRYPFNMYAANGYVVYVLQPSGAIGYGQEFSAMHVNNWGITVADEIIQATKAFLGEHHFTDPESVGCMGASYGGFMTMLLQTRTDIFASAISHAGISSISSYWGEGYWGYGYSAEASAESFPWNNPELYVDQSPLFSADKISTPLLLLHGASDTNVPVGESIQLYVALKLLGKEVELIEIEGEDHHILTYSKRIAWSNTKLAWFDKWLKNQPEWWDNLYPEKNY
jgi:dipeptidyl aminopeptidase/acylaminoacyl peptidase